MSLIQTWAAYFDSGTRQRGRQFFDEGRVCLELPPESTVLSAEVEGQNNTYTVTICTGSQGATAECGCPAFIDSQRCRHIWATLLAIAANQSTLVAYNWGLQRCMPAPFKARRRSPNRPRPRKTEPEWSTRLSLLRSPSRGSGSPSTPTSGLAPGLTPGSTPQTTANSLSRSTPGSPLWTSTDEHSPTNLAGSINLAPRRICYVIHAPLTHRTGLVVVQIRQQVGTAVGWSSLKPLKIDASVVESFDEPLDREIGMLLVGAETVKVDGLLGTTPRERRMEMFSIRPGARWALLERILGSGRCFLEGTEGDLDVREEPVRAAATEHGPWVFWLVGEQSPDGITVRGELRRDDRRLAIEEPALIIAGTDGVLIHDGEMSELDDCDCGRWIHQFREESAKAGAASPIKVPTSDIPKFLDRLYLLPDLPQIDFPREWAREQRAITPVPQIEFHVTDSDQVDQGSDRRSDRPPSDQLRTRMWFKYEDHQVKIDQPGRLLANEGDKVLIRRDLQAEREAIKLLGRHGFRANPADQGNTLILPRRQMGAALATMIREGWAAHSGQQLVRQSGQASFAVRSGVDWFELHGGVRFETKDGDQLVELPQILAAAKSGQQLIELKDGTHGLLPEQWLNEHRLLSSLGVPEEDHLRFTSSQAALIDAMLGESELVDVDAHFDSIRQRIRDFTRIETETESDRFSGELRPYQRDGLGWIRFLRDICMGGILADDMGLGKTVQVLAMLEARRSVATTVAAMPGGPNARPTADVDGVKAEHLPTLIVVPRSVVFNWIDEAQRFTPSLRVQTYSGTDRQAIRETFDEYDIIVTTYGLMRRDVQQLREHRFDYVILDEAQAIKNPQSQSAKAARLLRGNHRLALTGTPVENHLGDLWSIFEYLNPGMLGSNTKFAQLIRGDSGTGEPSASGRQRIFQSVDAAAQTGRALSPFILRRTKAQVLSELPDKTDQTLVCEMEPAQRAIYDELLRHYQRTLFHQGGNGPGKGTTPSTFMVLEALLRLRQAACHPALIDTKYADAPSAKLETLLENLTQLIDEGHKALIFSQFTSMLALVRPVLEQQGILYEYLDGQTRLRKPRIDRFQNDPDCSLFLISLKAGGLGLNLTAANYVFILDPWWNPAVEIQAIDRAHRIGQQQHVFAYRMICADTVEQRIAELQQKKQKLADAIVGEQENLLANLTKQDLELLLS